MRNSPTFVIPGFIHEKLCKHLLGNDQYEAAAIILCTRVLGRKIKILAKDIILVPYELCTRGEDHLIWPGEMIEEAIDKAIDDDLSIILIHSHPGGYFDFSDVDNKSDQSVIPSLFMARSLIFTESTFHGSAIMIPGGNIRARIYQHEMSLTEVELVAVYGDDLNFYWNPAMYEPPKNVRPLAFTEAMRTELGRLSACVVGVSGTGSLVAEQLGRMGFGELFLIDLDRVEAKNLNRIIYSTLEDAQAKKLKVNVLAEAIHSYRPETIVHQIPSTISCRQAILEALMADIVFCCVDSEEGRQICDRLASAFLMPLFDVGVTIPTRNAVDESKSILDVLGRIDYIQPGGSSLASRQVYTPASLNAEYLATVNPDAYKAQVKEGYMPGTLEQAPSVITVNMRAASACVVEFLSRAYPFRLDSNRLRARTTFSLAACEEEYQSEDELPHGTLELLAIGITKPLLGLPALG